MRRHIVRLPPIAVFLALTTLFAQVDQRIHRVENGLLRAVAVQGRPEPKRTIAERLAHYKVPGLSVAVVDRGEIEWARGYGFASVEDRKPVTPETRFQAASISKPVAAMVALRMVEMGKLALDEDVNLKLRSWKVPENEFTAKQKVTLRRLLSHTAGLTVHGFPGYAAGAEVPSLQQLLEGVKPANTVAIRPDIVPGTQFRYSGGGYEVMQQLVEDVTGKPFAQVARELVLEPLRMTHSTYEQPLPARYTAAAAVAYQPGGTAIAGKWHTYPERAAAGLWTTPSDLARVILEIQKPGKVLKPQTVEQMLTPVLDGYGLGFSLGEKDGAKSFSHGGANAGYRCQLFGYRDSRGGAVVMTNSDRGASVASELLRAVASEYGWPDYRQQEKTLVAVSPATLASYAGKYNIYGMQVTISVRDGALWGDAGAQGSGELLPESETQFFDPEGEIPPVRFEKAPDGSVEMVVQGARAKRQ